MTDRGTDSHKRNVGSLWVPIGSAIIAIGVVAGAAVTWATDRSELKAGTGNNEKQDVILRDHQSKLDELSRGAAVRDANDSNLREQLAEIRRQLDKIADRVGAKP